jgi:NADH dehydrogenase [ubiquinone] 1 alpha subcomplex assembly factor 6
LSQNCIAAGKTNNLHRKYDAPSRALIPFVPAHARDAYLAIRAFNVDVAQVLDTTSTPTVGQMRMQFWRDTVAKALEGAPPKEPVAILLAQAAGALTHHSRGKAKFSKSWFHRIINTREQYLGNPPYPNLSALESYAENTYSTMLYLTLSALPQASITTDHIASHIGKAMGITAVLRGIPFVAFPQPQPLGTSNSITGAAGPTQGAVMLPLDVMAEANVREEDVFRQGSAAPGLRDAVFTVATRANDHLITARDMISKLRSEGTLGHDFEHQHDGEHQYSPQQLSAGSEVQLAEIEQAFGVFMPSITTQSWLDRLQKVDFDVFDPSLRKADWKLPWKAYWAFSRRQL